MEQDVPGGGRCDTHCRRRRAALRPSESSLVLVVFRLLSPGNAAGRQAQQAAGGSKSCVRGKLGSGNLPVCSKSSMPIRCL
ncbi:hypothetical protein PVAP13_2KG411470 [Panicum virgatum]|uniref:Uncharacterized protein n=1 Tax=Panicum virgatum TaxID=38727 RepID=A0A8T0W7E1_PANVG|nr:hypothetical protein PVAP13_2KG411470 [Panicum virgatum]